MPSVRSRLVSAKVPSKSRGEPIPASAVSWCMTASGRAAAIAASTAGRSSASTTTGSAPAARMASARAGERVVPVTWWPAATSSGISREPMAPAAPARKMRI